MKPRKAGKDTEHTMENSTQTKYPDTLLQSSTIALLAAQLVSSLGKTHLSSLKLFRQLLHVQAVRLCFPQPPPKSCHSIGLPVQTDPTLQIATAPYSPSLCSAVPGFTALGNYRSVNCIQKEQETKTVLVGNIMLLLVRKNKNIRRLESILCIRMRIINRRSYTSYFNVTDA